VWCAKPLVILTTGPADRVLIYLIMFIRECIVKSQKCPNAAEARKTLNTFALSNFSIPGDSKFPLNNLYPAPASRQDGGVPPDHTATNALPW
jgi:actin related protein 2/3 complex subunit 3